MRRPARAESAGGSPQRRSPLDIEVPAGGEGQPSGDYPRGTRDRSEVHGSPPPRHSLPATFALSLALFVAVLAMALLVANPSAQGMDGPLPAPRPQPPKANFVATGAPHGPYEARSDACATCHRSHGAPFEPLLVAGTDEGAGAALCATCHGPGGGATEVSTHSNKDFAAALQPPFYVPCTDCHDAHQQPNATNGDGANNRLVRPLIADATVRFDANSGEDSYDDGLDDASADSVCVVCHTTTAHNSNTSAEKRGEGHGPVGANCITCHTHRSNATQRVGFMETCSQCHAATAATLTTGSHAAHFDSSTSGPGITQCTDCHTSPFASSHNNLTVNFKDGGADLAATNACDGCHSKGGDFNGVDEAKANWSRSTPVGCKGCHDGGSSTVKGIAAPNVVGDGSSYGFYRNGHGSPDIVKECEDCHDPNAPHFDGKARTYSAGSNNYQAAYRLKFTLTIPLAGSGTVQANYDLCFRCHSYADVVQSSTAGYFRNNGDNLHDQHLGQIGDVWDSDWNGSLDSRASCPACHNVHGSPSVKMLQHGELIGPTYSPPALNFRWYKDLPFTQSNETTTFTESRYGVCSSFCHEQQSYFRDPSTPTPTPSSTPTSTPTATPTRTPTATSTP